MADRHYLTGAQAKAVDTVLNWYQRIGRRLELPKPKPPRELPILTPFRIHIGKLDSSLSTTNSTGVVVSIWSGKPEADTGENITGVVTSDLLTPSGTFASGSGVKIEFIDGHWKVTGAPCS